MEWESVKEIAEPYVVKSELTVRIRRFLAGDAATVKQSCRSFCMRFGLCVTVTLCDFIYTGGSESGVEIGLTNYPRFPSTKDELRDKATRLAVKLMEDCEQLTVLLVDDETTVWVTRRDEDLGS